MRKIHKEHYFELAQFCIDYHSGQWSRGYRLLCRLGERRNWTPALEAELRESEIYMYLVEHYADKV